jgi:alkylated DNA nucleotide flippase Atl1
LSVAAERDVSLQAILEFLNRERIRATYGAVAEALGIPVRSVGRALGTRRQEASWVVNAKSGKPTKYGPGETHPALRQRPGIIRTGADLLRRLKSR